MSLWLYHNAFSPSFEFGILVSYVVQSMVLPIYDFDIRNFFCLVAIL